MSNTLTPTQVACLLKQAGATPSEALTLLSHVSNESGWDASAQNTSAPCSAQGNYAVGLFQICNFSNRIAQFGDLLDPSNNTKAAVSILRNSGETAWTSSPSGNYSDTVNSVYADSGSCGGSTDTNLTSIDLNPFDAIGKSLSNIFTQWQNNLTQIFLVFIGVSIIAIGIWLLLFGEMKKAAKLIAENPELLA